MSVIVQNIFSSFYCVNPDSSSLMKLFLPLFTMHLAAGTTQSWPYTINTQV